LIAVSAENEHIFRIFVEISEIYVLIFWNNICYIKFSFMLKN